jgi:hypothetical protein
MTEEKPCGECPDSVQRYFFEGKEYVLAGEIYSSFYKMALILFSDVPDAKERLERALGPLPTLDPAETARFRSRKPAGYDAMMRSRFTVEDPV